MNYRLTIQREPVMCSSHWLVASCPVLKHYLSHPHNCKCNFNCNCNCNWIRILNSSELLTHHPVRASHVFLPLTGCPRALYSNITYHILHVHVIVSVSVIVTAIVIEVRIRNSTELPTHHPARASHVFLPLTGCLVPCTQTSPITSYIIVSVIFIVIATVI